MMRTKVLSLTALFIFGAVSVFASVKTEKIKVNGKCGMCKSRIEKAVNSMEGVESATWKNETQELEVKYDDQKTSTMQIQTSIAITGHDTEMFSANDKKYAELPDCCKYQRDENREKMDHSEMTPGYKQGTSANPGCDHDISETAGSCCEK
ncbi:MAG: heavy-metal-associated domain-containing protein [Bacteroidales bacterium]|nr:heavy-metal-associated domain-containing protein [Bacteroidales bacterium]